MAISQYSICAYIIAAGALSGHAMAFQSKLQVTPPPIVRGTASIAGTVVGPDSKPIKYAIVSYAEQLSKDRDGQVLLAGSLVADGEGRFEASKLVAGTYRMCVAGSGWGYLDPCIWGSTKNTFTVADGQAVSGAQIRLESGAVLRIRVDDPQGLLDKNEGKKIESNLTLCIHSASDDLIPIRTAAQDKTGKDLEALVPAGNTVNVVVLTRHFQLDDPNGNPVSKSGNGNRLTGPGVLGEIPILVPAGVKTHSVKLAVKGYQ